MFVPEKRIIKKHDRESIRVTNEYVEKLARTLPERDFKIIHLLLKFPFMTSEQIEMIAFNDLKPSCRRTKANERIRKLYHAHCIDRWFPPVSEGAGSAKQHLILDRAGLLALAKKRGMPTTDERIRKWRKRNRIPQDYGHTLKIIDFYAMLHLLNRQLGIFQDQEGKDKTVGEILRWEEGSAKITFPMRVEGRNQNITIKPDAFCIYKWNQQGGFKMFYLEADNATEEMETLQTKIRRYAAMYESGTWRDTQWARATQGRLFPAIVFLLHDEDQAKELRNFAKRQDTQVRFLFTTYSRLYSSTDKVYDLGGGRKRSVPLEEKIQLLEPIYLSSKEEGEVRL